MLIDPNTLQVLQTQSSQTGGVAVSLTLVNSVNRAGKPAPLPPAGKPVEATVSQSKNNGEVVLRTASGQEIRAKLTPPLPEGSHITFIPQRAGDVKVVKIEMSHIAANTPAASGPQTPAHPANQNAAPAPAASPAAATSSAPPPAAKPPAGSAAAAQGGGTAPVAAAGAGGADKPPVATPLTPQVFKQMVTLAQQTPVTILPQYKNMTLPNAGDLWQIKLVSATRADGSQLARVISTGATPSAAAATPSAAPLGTPVTTPPPPGNAGAPLKVFMAAALPKDTLLNLRFLSSHQARLQQATAPFVSATPPVAAPLAPMVAQPAAAMAATADTVQLSGQGQNSLQQPLATLALATPVPTNIPTDVVFFARVIGTAPVNDGQQAVAGTPAANKVAPVVLQLSNGRELKLLPTINLPVYSTLQARLNTAAGHPVLEVLSLTPPAAHTTGGTGMGQNGEAAPATQTHAAGNVSVAAAKTPQVAAGIDGPVGSILQAKVVNNTSEGVVTLQLANGQQVTAQSARPLPVGSTLTLHITGHSTQAAAHTPASKGHAENDGAIATQNATLLAIQHIQLANGTGALEKVLQHAFFWPKLAQGIAQLESANPAQHTQLTQALPAPEKPTFLLQLIRFADAAATGQLERVWGDDVLQSLRALGLDVNADTPHLTHSHQRHEGGAEGWRSLFFPYYNADENSLHQGNFFWRNNQKHQQEPEQEFVLSFALSAFGPMQLNGVMQGNHVQLTLQMQKLPSAQFRQELAEVVRQTLQALKLNGSLSVEVVAGFRHDPLAQIIQQSSPVNVQV